MTTKVSQNCGRYYKYSIFCVGRHLNSPPPPRMNRFNDRIKNNVNVNFLLLFYFVVIKARVAVMFSLDLQVNVEVLEIFKQAGPTFIEKGQEIIIKHE